MEYLDIENSVKHYLLHKGVKTQISEPIGFDAAKFVIDQDKKRYGRDVEFSPSDLTFSADTNFRGLSHQFKELLESYKTEGFESDWQYILEIEGIEYILGQLDFATASTDKLTYFTTNIIQENTQAIIKSREDVEVNLFSDTDLDGNTITPLQTKKIYLQATPEKQESRWEMYDPYYAFRGNPGGGGDFFRDFNPFPIIKESEIQETLSAPIETDLGRNEFAIIEATNELSNVTLKIRGLNFRMEIDNFINNFGYAYCQLFYCIGTEYLSANAVEIFGTGTMSQDTIHSFELTDQDYTIENLFIPRDQKLFLLFAMRVDTQNNPFTAQLWVDSGSVEADAVSTSISSVIETFTLGDAMQQVVKSISGLETDAPRFIGESAEFYRQHITNGLLMRNITNKPFNLSLSKILDYLPELNGDYEVNDGKVFFGLYEDFYRDEKIASFTTLPDDSFETSFNERYSVNKYNFKYAKYEKSNDEAKSRESVHTQMQMLLPNKMVDNTKDVNVGFIRDSFLIESTRKEAIKVKEDVATEQDQDIFIIDILKKDTPIIENQQLTVYHKKEVDTLFLLNDDSVNWEFFGFQVGDTITLTYKNSGLWSVNEITPDRLKLVPLFFWTEDFEGYASTGFAYSVTQTLLTNRTNEGFSIIEGTTTPAGFSNLRFTPKRNTWYYWGRYLSACCQYRKSASDRIKVTEFIHNGDLTTKYQDDGLLTFTEDSDINTSILTLGLYEKALVTPELERTTVICDFSVFWALRQKIRTIRGYIEVIDSNGNSIDLFPKNVGYQWQNNLMEIEGEVKAVF